MKFPSCTRQPIKCIIHIIMLLRSRQNNLLSHQHRIHQLHRKLRFNSQTGRQDAQTSATYSYQIKQIFSQQDNQLWERRIDLLLRCLWECCVPLYLMSPRALFKFDLILSYTPALVTFRQPSLLHCPNPSRLMVAYESFQQQWFCNSLTAIFGNDFGLLVSYEARSVLTATKIMILSDHLGASLIKVKVKNTFRVI